MCKISIIVPVYNVEDYLDECIESILKQTIQSFELILIDDGSTDNSSKICDRYKEKDNRIRVIHKINGGLSSARNAGLEIARGEYISFVDSDDFVQLETAYEDMYNIAINNNSDIVAGNCIWYYDEKKNYPLERDMNLFCKKTMSGQEFFKSSLISHRVYAPVWLNIYSKKLLVENNIKFFEGVYHEDEEFTPRVLLKAKTVSIYNKDFYAYRQRNGSITNNEITNIKKATDIFKICIGLEIYADKIEDKQLRLLFKNYLAYLVLGQIYEYKIKHISKNLKRFIKRNVYTIEGNIKSILININVSIYIFTVKLCQIRNNGN